MAITFEIRKSEAMERYAALNRAATVAKARGDWAEAIELLKSAKQLEGNLYAETRLAKFMQQGGRFKEALVEIRWLLEHSNVWAETIYMGHPRSVRRRQQAGWNFRIHVDAALICKRERRKDLQALHESEAERWDRIREKLEPLAERDEKMRRQAWLAARKEGPRGMEVFYQKWGSMEIGVARK